MRVAIDARKIADFGIGSYIRGLVGALVELRPEWTFVLVGQPSADGPDGDHVEWLADRSAKYGLGEIRSLARRAHEARADLFHAPHYVFPVGLACPGVVTIHDCIHLRYPAQLPRPLAILPRRLSHIYARTMMRHAGRAARRVIAVSEATAHDLQRLAGLDGDRIEVIANGCDPSYRRQPTPEELAAADRLLDRCGAGKSPYVLFAGNPKPHKNLPRLIAACAAAGDGERLRLVLAGVDPAVAERLRRAAVPAPPADRLHAVGKVPTATLRGLFARARILAAPSMFEGFGLTALEAMAAGVPVVAGGTGGLAEVVADAGLLVDPGSTEEIGRALGQLWQDRALRAEMVARGRARAAGFTWREAARRTAAVYETALEART